MNGLIDHSGLAIELRQSKYLEGVDEINGLSIADILPFERRKEWQDEGWAAKKTAEQPTTEAGHAR